MILQLANNWSEQIWLNMGNEQIISHIENRKSHSDRVNWSVQTQSKIFHNIVFQHI